MSSSSSDWIHVRSPFVYWAQTESAVSLKVDIPDAQNPRVNIETDQVTLDATGSGSGTEGENEYHFVLPLAHPINSKASTFRVLDRHIDILLQKEVKGWWSKVISTNKKPVWLKIDFDRWKSPDDEDEIPPDVMRDFPHVQEQLGIDEFGYKIENLRNVYLFLYNLFQFVGYLYVVGVLSVRFMKDGPASFHKAFDLVGFALCYCQFVQLLEIVHPILGFTRTSIGMALLQISGRGVILFGLIWSEERIQDKPVVFFLFYIWAIADVIRYPFYMLQIYKVNIYAVTWLRYTAWIILYPAGIACEAVVIFACIPYFVETGKYSLTLPNALNMTFSFTAIMRIYLLFGLFPAAYSLLQNMRRNRKKVLENLGKKKIVIKKEL